MLSLCPCRAVPAPALCSAPSHCFRQSLGFLCRLAWVLLCWLLPCWGLVPCPFHAQAPLGLGVNAMSGGTNLFLMLPPVAGALPTQGKGQPGILPAHHPQCPHKHTLSSVPACSLFSFPPGLPCPVPALCTSCAARSQPRGPLLCAGRRRFLFSLSLPITTKTAWAASAGENLRGPCLGAAAWPRSEL